jgi:hypothetical protein
MQPPAEHVRHLTYDALAALRPVMTPVVVDLTLRCG